MSTKRGTHSRKTIMKHATLFGMNKQPLLLLLFIFLLSFPQLSETSVTPLLQTIALSFNTEVKFAELSLTLFFAGIALGISVWGVAADLWGRRRALLFGIAIYIIGTLCCALSSTIVYFLAATFIQAFGISAASVITLTLLRDLCEEKERAGVFAIIGMALSFSPAFGPFIGTFFETSWQMNFYFLALLGTALFIWANIKVPETVSQISQKTSLLKLASTMLKDRFIWACSTLIGICNGVLFCFFAEAPFVFINNLKIEAGLYSCIGLTVSLAFLVSGMFTRKTVGKNSPEQLIKYGGLTMAFGAILYTLTSCILYSSALVGPKAAFTLIPSLFTIFLGIGLIIPNCLSIALKSYKSSTGTAGSFFGCSYYIWIALLTFGISELHTGSMLVLPGYLLACCILCSIIATYLQRAAHKLECTPKIAS